jgi:hypothetical protein
MLARARKVLEGRWSFAVAAALAVLFTAPSLFGGRSFDDLNLENTARHVPVWAILAKRQQDHKTLVKMRDRGAVPWWSDPSGHSPAHLRPVGSLSHAIDFHAFPGKPMMWHLHSVLLYGLAAAVATLAYRRLLGPTWVAGLAAVLFAIDDGHGFAAGHVASRATLVALVLGGLGITAYDRAVRSGARVGYVVGPILVGLGMLSYELSAGFLGYVVAHLVTLDRRPWKRRLVTTVPWIVVTVAWAVAFEATGSGSTGSGIYTDPVTEPGVYVTRALKMLPGYAASLLVGIPSDFWPFVESRTWWLAWPVLLALSLLAAIALRPRDRMGAFLALGAALALVPSFAAWSNDRMLVVASFGVFGLVARHLGAVADGEPASRALGALFVAAHLVVAPLLLPVRANLLALTYGRVHAVAVPSIPSDDQLGKQTLVIANAPDFLIAASTFLRMADGGVAAARYRTLAITTDAISWQREDETTLVATVPEGLLRDPFSTLNRGDQVPFRAGDRVELTGLAVEVVAVVGGRPSVIRYHFALPLEDPSLRWLTWSGDRFVPWSPPAPGSQTVEPPIDYRRLMLGF